MTINPTPNVSSRFGAPLGRMGGHTDPDCPNRLYLRHLPLDSGGYDRGGAYWGHGAPLYWCGDDEGLVDMYFRARSRDAAKAIVRAEVPGARFYR